MENQKNQAEFFSELRKRVNTYFQENNISKQADFNMKFKTTFMVVLYFLPLILMLTGVVHGLWPVLLMWVLMGFGMSGIGLSVMHDANHGSYSKNKMVNKAMGFLLNFVGGYPINWKIQHNVRHHANTNVNGYDDDIEKSFIMRMSPYQKRKGFFRFQMYYAPILYSLMTIYWYLIKDFEQLFRYNKENLLKDQGITLGRAFVEVIINKLWYMVLFLVLPLVFIDLPWWQILIGFTIMHLMSGLILAFIFQSAHVIEDNNFFEMGADGKLENTFAVHQLMTTANFAEKSRLFSWFVGGLNYQIEHHLFPSICHVHYRNLSPIVRQTAQEYQLPYHQHKTFRGALKSHFILLNKLGTTD